MKSSVLEEIRTLRNNKDINLNTMNNNRYCILIREKDGSETAYCYSTPIYNLKSKHIVDLQFHSEKNSFYTYGSNVRIDVQKDICMQNQNGYIKLLVDDIAFKPQGRSLVSPSCVISPTLNGVLFNVNSNNYTIIMEASKPFLKIRANSKYFAYMSEKFKPFGTLSSLGTVDLYNHFCAPALVTYKKLNDKQVALTLRSGVESGKHILFEVNMYENKLFQDTTVESKNPKENNVYGGIAFLGNTECFGEQWLYSRPDFSKISELLNKQVRYVKLHLPNYNKNNFIVLSGFELTNRFCSFGSTWNKKIALSKIITDSFGSNAYQSIDITNLIVNKKSKAINHTEGLILRTKVKGCGFSAVATGDNYYTPQILEINYI